MYKTLEHEYAAFVGSSHAISCSSGTAGLHLALIAAGVGPGDEVIVPDFTMAACGFAVTYSGAVPVFVDCKADLTIDESLIEQKITSRTKAIMPVHIYGRLAHMPAILEIARVHNLKVIEDACEAQGAVKNSGADFTVYSFYRNKIISAEEGGIVTTENAKAAKLIEHLKNMAFDKDHTYYHDQIGFNYRMADSQATMALRSLRSYQQNSDRRRAWELLWQRFYSTPKRDAVWVYDILCENAEQKAARAAYFTEKAIAWRHFFRPLSTMPMWSGQEVGKNALSASQRGLYVCFPG